MRSVSRPSGRRPPTTRRLWASGVAAAVLAVSAGVALVVGPDGSARDASPAAASVDLGGPAVALLLHDHADALLRRDRAGYTAGLDDAPAAAAFRATQLAAFDHTDGVPFAAFDLRYDRTVVDPGPLAAARARLGDASTVIVRAELTYAFAGVDAEPAAHPVYLTLVRRGDGWRLAGDTDLADAGGASWRGPWDFGPLVVARAAAGPVLVHPAEETPAGLARAQALARALAADVDAGVAAVDAVWGTGWPRRVAVVVAASQAEMDAVAGAGHPVDAVAAVAAAEPVASVTAGPDADAGQRIVVSGPTVPGLTATGRAVLLRHELTHVATRAVTVSGMPTWVVEGFADYVGNLAGTQPPRTVAAELATRVAASGPPTTLPADAAFVPAQGSAAGDTGPPDTGPSDTGPSDTGPSGTGPGGTGSGGGSAAAAYEQAWYALRTVARLGGPAAPAAFYRAVATAVASGRAAPAAVDAALQATTHLDTAAFTARWRTLVADELS